jgi:CheY-like chemotaxis protein
MKTQELDVLVVEDDRSIRENLTVFLSLEGYEVAAVCDGLEALAYLERERLPRLILLDLQMPRMGGLEFLDSRSEAMGEIPVCIVSGVAEVPRDLKGVRGLIQKPFHFDELLKMVSEVCRSA